MNKKMKQVDVLEKERLLTSDEAAKFLGLASRKSLESMRWRRIGPRFVKIGKLVRYRLSDLLAFIEAGVR